MVRILLTSGITALLAGCFAAPVYEGETSDHFDGTRFHNRESANKGPLDMVRMGWGFLTQSERWPKQVDNPDIDAAVTEAVTEGIAVTYINHSTLLVQVGGLNILTDPIWAERASPVSFAGPKRVREPGMALSELPDIDVVLISHNHYDHLDAETLLALAGQQETPPLVLSGLGNAGLYRELGLTRFQDLDWNDSVDIGDTRITFVECRHRSGRGIGDQMKTLWGSFVMETPAGNIYFAGDTGYSPHFRAQGETYGPFALAILPIGAYEPRWFMKDIHLNPEEAVMAHEDLGSEFSVSMHFGVFQLTYEAIDQPAIDLAVALRNREIDAARFWVPEPGESRQLQTGVPGGVVSAEAAIR